MNAWSLECEIVLDALFVRIIFMRKGQIHQLWRGRKKDHFFRMMNIGITSNNLIYEEKVTDVIGFSQIEHWTRNY